MHLYLNYDIPVEMPSLRFMTHAMYYNLALNLTTY